MPKGFHPPLEEYLEAMVEFAEEGTEVIQARLAERLGHSAPSVSEIVRRLIDEGFVASAGRTLTLTDKGTKRAESVVRKHRLAERLLTDVIGLPWPRAHLEAGRWEHVISDEVEEHLVVLLGNPLTCPHGNPIPGAGGPERDLTVLEDVESGARLRLERIAESVELDMTALEYLDKHDFRPGSIGQLQERGPDGTMVVDVEGSAVAIGRSLGSQLFVTVL